MEFLIKVILVINNFMSEIQAEYLGKQKKIGNIIFKKKGYLQNLIQLQK
jgi:hypothetical protein